MNLVQQKQKPPEKSELQIVRKVRISDGKLLGVYRNPHHASECDKNMDYSRIHRICKGVSKPPKGCTYTYKFDVVSRNA